MPPPDKIFTFKNLYKAYLGCRENKRTTYHAAKFEMSFEAELLKLREELTSHNYQPGPSICFAISDPKLREVWAAFFSFSPRVYLNSRLKLPAVLYISMVNI